MQQPRIFLLIILGWGLSYSSLLGQNHRVSPSVTVLYLPETKATVPDTFLVTLQSQNWTSVSKEFPPELTVLSAQARHIWVRSSQEVLLASLQQFPYAVRVARESMRPVEEARVIDLNLNRAQINRIHDEYPSLTGAGQIVSIRERTIEDADLDLRGRLLPSPAADELVSSHATAMATVIGGDGTSSAKGRGVAKAVQFQSSAYGDLLPDDFTQLPGVYVQNHSYGTEPESFYGGLAEAYDEFSYDNPHVLHLFSAGNRGLDTCKQGLYEGVPLFGNMTGNFKQAKNVLTIGAADLSLGGGGFLYSSRGPAYDGRVKPELYCYSADGTSKAVSQVSGLCVLLQQAYQAQYQQVASSALLKAILVATARPFIQAPIVGPYGGFGEVKGWRAVEAIRQGNFIMDSVSRLQTQAYGVYLPADAQDLRVSLVWTDTAASPNPTQRALYNDLDLRVKQNGSTVAHLPLGFDASPERLNQYQPAVEKRDSLNNVELVVIADLTEGFYFIEVDGNYLRSPQQHFALAFSWEEKNQFTWEFPVGGDNMPYDGETATFFRWFNTMNADSGRLQYKLLRETAWQELATVELKSQNWLWEVPQAFGSAQARMIIGTDTFVTDSFMLSHVLRPRMILDCEEDLAIDWGYSTATEGYQIWRLETEGWKADTVINRPPWFSKKADFPQELLAIQAIEQGGRRGLRSYAFDYQTLGGNCYIQEWYADDLNEEGIYLNLVLATDVGLRSIYFEREEKEGQYLLLDSISPTKLHRYLDAQPPVGIHRYRVTVNSMDGRKYQAETSIAYYLEPGDFWIFPNPLPLSEPLNIYWPQEAGVQPTLILYDLQGRKVREFQTFNSKRVPILLRNIGPGLYHYQILVGESVQKTGKLILTPE